MSRPPGSPRASPGKRARRPRESTRARREPKVAIVYEDPDLIVVDKPPGMLSVRSAADREPGVFEWLRERMRSGAARGREDGGIWLVHRLDRDASGLLAFARSRRAFHWLKDDLRAHRIERRYAAVVSGELAVGEAGSLESFLSTGAGRVKSRPLARARDVAAGPGAASAQARFARTHYRVLASGRGHSLLELSLDSGRRHQIRVHLQELGHPIVGDRLYADSRGRRLCLHAAALALEHPGTGRWLALASEVPAEFFALVGASPAAVALSARDEAGAPAAHAQSPTSWEPVADWYDGLLDERGSDHYRDVVMPGALRLLAPAVGQRVLDIACGQGAWCRVLADLGVEAVGVDASPRLIELAEQRGRPRADRRGRARGPVPRYAVADARALGAAQLGRFAAVTCVLCLTNIDPIEPVLQGAAALLDPRGVLVAVIPHPAFRAPRQTSWGWDRSEQGGPRQYRRVDGYLSAGRARIVANPGQVARGAPPIETWTFHRPLEHYVRALADAGFALERLEEWTSLRTSGPGPRAAEENRARREIPLFLGLRARLR